MKKLLLILIILFLTVGVYLLFSDSIANKILESSTINLNDKRISLGLNTLTPNLQYDINYPNNIDAKEKLTFLFNNQKAYTKRWNNQEKGASIYKHKLIGFLKSYWFWENKVFFEIDTYKNPISELEIEELIVSYDYLSNEYFARLDTIESELSIKLKNNRLDSINNYLKDNNLYICGTAMAEIDGSYLWDIDTIGLSKQEVNLILKKWGVKIK